MSANPVFVQHLADATGRPVEVSPVREATTLGAGFLAGLAVGTWSGWDEMAPAIRARFGHSLDMGGLAGQPGAEAASAEAAVSTSTPQR
jgi:glycerol kinase